MRPSNGVRFDTTSGGIDVFANSGGSACSIGMSTSENIDKRLRLAVFDDLEVVLRQVPDEVALRIGDDGVDLDVVDLDLEGDGGRLRSGRGGGAGACCAPTTPAAAATARRVGQNVCA